MGREKKAEKTNVMRILEREGIPHQTHAYDHQDGVIDGQGVAAKLGQDPAQVFKTLVCRGHSGSYLVFCIPVAAELDLKAAARAAGEKSVEMIHVREINQITGYVRGGCSPVGMKKPYKTVVDESCLLFDTIIFSAGKIGFQVECAPGDLLKLVGGTTAEIAIL